MSATATSTRTIRKVLSEGNPNELADAAKKMLLGDMLKPVDETITIASGTTIKLSTQSAKLRKALVLQSVRVVTGTATGQRTVGDTGSTPSTTLVSFDGDTITFEAAITVARIVWVPAASTDIDTALET